MAAAEGAGRSSSTRGPVTRAQLSLIGAFELTVSGRPLPLSHSAERVIAYLALAGRPVRRSRVAGELWPDVPESRALGNLRSALWRMPARASWLVASVGGQLSLAHDVLVDLAEALELAEAMARAPEPAGLKRLDDLTTAGEILGDWGDEWLRHHREQFRELWLSALERVCDRLITEAAYAPAVQAALVTVEADPYRESSRRQLVRAYLGEGNVADAMREYDAYRDLIGEELGVAPSDLMEEVIAGIRPNGEPAGARR
jgi:DNA-binding SARP family transcriptional activator